MTAPVTPAEPEPAAHPAECGDACTEHHTYGPDCAALDPNWDPTVGLRYRYAAALYQAGEDKAFAPYLDREQCTELAEAVLAARDVELTNSRRIWKQQWTELHQLHQASQQRTITLVERIDAARAWARHNLTPDQQTGLLGALRGDEPEQPAHHALDHNHHGDAHTPPHARCICGHEDDGADAIDAHISDTNQEPNP
jgi:hypothetical protein